MKRKGFRFSAASSRPMSSGLAPERRYYSKKSARGVRYLAPALQFFSQTPVPAGLRDDDQSEIPAFAVHLDR